MPEEIRWWRYMWVATMPDGRVIPQFDDTGKKTEWKALPDIPVKVSLKTFSKSLALKVRATSNIPALDITAAPVDVANMGEGILAGQDQRTYTNLPLVECQVCKFRWIFDPTGKPECPKCFSKDEWFCTACQSMKTPLALNGNMLCPDCKTQGKTRGLKRIMKFKVFSTPPMYDTFYWIRSPPIETRVDATGKVSVVRYDKPLPVIPKVLD